jgi:hypothetical protein
MPDLAECEAKRQKLLASDDEVLPPRKRPGSPLNTLSCHDNTKRSSGYGSPPWMGGA